MTSVTLLIGYQVILDVYTTIFLFLNLGAEFMVIHFLLIGLIVALVFDYNLSNGDIFKPSTLYISGFVLATIAAVMNINYWGVDLGIKTLVVIMLGVFSFLVGNLVANYTPINYKIVKSRRYYSIEIDTWKVAFFTVYGVLVTLLLYKEVNRIALFADNYHLKLGLMTAVRSALMNGYELNEMVEQALKISTCSAYVFLFVTVYNCTYKGIGYIRKNSIYVLPIIIYMTQVLLLGGRLSLITFFVSGIFMWYYFEKEKRSWARLVSKQFIKRLIFGLCCFVLLFYYSKELVGRVSDENFLEYITRYFGGSIPLLDMYLHNFILTTNNRLGEESFTGLINSLSKIGICEGGLSVSLEFRYSNTGVMLGNVYTSLRRAFNDFGWFGVFALPFIMSIFFNVLYRKIRNISTYTVNSIFLFIVYSSLLGLIPMQAMEDQFYINKLSIGYAIQLVLMYITIIFLFKIKV